MKYTLIDQFYQIDSNGSYYLYQSEDGLLSFGWDYNPEDLHHDYCVWYEGIDGNRATILELWGWKKARSQR